MLQGSVCLSLVMAVACYFCFWNLGARPFGHHDESIHASVALTMYKTGAIFRPEFDGTPYFNKPPFKLWLTALGVNFLGSTNFAFRFWDGLSGVGTVLISFLFARQVFSSITAGFFSIFLLMGSRLYLFSHVVRHGTQDSMLVFLSTLTLYRLWAIYDANRNDHIFKEGLSIGLVVGLAVLTKSVSGLLPLVIALLFSFLSTPLFGFRLSFFKLLIVAGLTSLGVASLWYLPHIIWSGVNPLVALEIDRFSNGYHNSHKPLLYFKTLARGGALPPVILALSTCWLLSLIIARRKEAPQACFLFCWGVGLLATLSILPSRIAHYLAPALPAYSIAAGGFLFWLIRLGLICIQSSKFQLRCCALILLGLFMFLSAHAGYYLRVTSKRVYHARVQNALTYDDIVKLINASLKTARPETSIFLVQTEPNKRNYGFILNSQRIALKVTSGTVDEARAFMESDESNVVVANGSAASFLIDKFSGLSCVEYSDAKNRGVMLLKDPPIAWPVAHGRCLGLRDFDI